MALERADAEVSLALQEAFFADIAERYPGWAPAPTRIISGERSTSIVPGGGVHLRTNPSASACPNIFGVMRRRRV